MVVASGCLLLQQVSTLRRRLLWRVRRRLLLSYILIGFVPIERLENQANSERTELDGLIFQKVRNVINDEYLKQRGKEDFSTALKEWKEYLSNSKVVGRDKKKANQQVESVNRQANGAWRSLRNKAERMNSDSAVRLLEKNLPRFQGCVFNGVDLGKEIQDKINALGG